MRTILAIDPGNENSAFVNIDRDLKAYKVYRHTCPNEKIYIGVTSLNPTERWRDGDGYKNSVLFNRAIKKYGWEAFKHEILFENLTKEEAEKIEINLIKETKSNNKKYGYNIESGGNVGATGVKRRPETLEKMRVANLGKKLSDETKTKISKTLKGRRFTKEHSKKKSLAQTGAKNHRFGKKASSETRRKMVESQTKGKDNPLSRPVAQISNQTGEIIKVWGSMGDARRELGIKHCTISDCCRGKQKTSGGYIWRYYEGA